jgi:hypothetical protein
MNRRIVSLRLAITGNNQIGHRDASEDEQAQPHLLISLFFA